MTEKQYRVIADRDKGDNPQWGEVESGDRVWFSGPRDDVDRIERPVPTTDDENAWIDHELASPSVPTREQIAEEAERRYPGLNPNAEELTYPRSALRNFKRGAFAEGVDWALALMNGADR